MASTSRPASPRGPECPCRSGPPAAVFLGPAFSNQRPYQSVPVLREVVPEATLHAGRSLVRRVQLDVGRRHANDFTTPRAPRFIRIAIRADDDFGVLTPPPDVEDADDLNVLAGPHAAGAEDAGRHVVADHGIARPLVARAQRQIAVL